MNIDEKVIITKLDNFVQILFHVRSKKKKLEDKDIPVNLFLSNRSLSRLLFIERY